MEEFLVKLGNAELLSVIPALTLFVFFYGLRSNWRATRVGRALFWMTLSMLVVCVLFCISLFFGQWPGRSYARVVAYGFVAWTVWRMFWELRRIQKTGQYEDADLYEERNRK